MSERAGCKISGPIPLPLNIHKITVNKSPHVYKKSREQFEIRSLSRLIVIYFPTPELVKDLSSFQLPAGVSVNVFANNKIKINDSDTQSDFTQEGLENTIDKISSPIDQMPKK